MLVNCAGVVWWDSVRHEFNMTGESLQLLLLVWPPGWDYCVTAQNWVSLAGLTLTYFYQILSHFSFLLYVYIYLQRRKDIISWHELSFLRIKEFVIFVLLSNIKSTQNRYVQFAILLDNLTNSCNIVHDECQNCYFLFKHSNELHCDL